MKLFQLGFVSLIAGAVGVTAQGTVNFANAGGGLNAPLFHPDGTTRLGSDWSVQLDGGSDVNSLEPLAVTTFLDGGGAGYFNGGVVTVSTVTPGMEGQFQLSVWWNWGQSITSYAMAEASGVGRAYTSVFANLTGGVGSPPSPPTALTGVADAAWTYIPGIIPEPSTMALLACGGLMLLLRLRRGGRARLGGDMRRAEGERFNTSSTSIWAHG